MFSLMANDKIRLHFLKLKDYTRLMRSCFYYYSLYNIMIFIVIYMTL